jgi:ParB family chromosome partitioning protein
MSQAKAFRPWKGRSAAGPQATAMPAGVTAPEAAQAVRHIDALSPHPDNPRDDVRADDPKILELAASIIEYGVIEPLVVNKDGQVYAGHRRRVASGVAFKRTGDRKYLVVPVVLSHVPPEAALALMLQENMQRQDLNPLEEARAMHTLMGRKSLTVAGLAREVARPAKDVSERLSILKCEPVVQALFAAEELPLGAAPWLARVREVEKQTHYAGLLARRQITLATLKEVATAQAAPAPTQKQVEAERAEDIPDPGRDDEEGEVESVASSRRRVLDDGPPPKSPAGKTGPPTRAEAMANLRRAMETKRAISLFNFKLVVESLCCACGMEGEATVCRACPFPRIIQAVVGRAD